MIQLLLNGGTGSFKNRKSNTRIKNWTRRNNHDHWSKYAAQVNTDYDS